MSDCRHRRTVLAVVPFRMAMVSADSVHPISTSLSNQRISRSTAFSVNVSNVESTPSMLRSMRRFTSEGHGSGSHCRLMLSSRSYPLRRAGMSPYCSVTFNFSNRPAMSSRSRGGFFVGYRRVLEARRTVSQCRANHTKAGAGPSEGRTGSFLMSWE